VIAVDAIPLASWPKGVIDRAPVVAKESLTETQGKVFYQALANIRFKVKLDSGHEVVAHISGKMRKHFIRFLPGDTVTLVLSDYDPNQGRITYRGPLRQRSADGGEKDRG
jgi:translation initiation factor IF-1